MTKLHIYDMDGTLLDSMRMWDDLSPDYLRRKGHCPSDDLVEILDPMTQLDGARYMVEHFDLGISPEQVLQELDVILHDHYHYDLPLFDDAMEDLEKSAADGVPMVILTNTQRAYVLPALERTGIAGFFDKVYTTEIGLTKTDPEIFRYVCREMGVDPSDTLVHEDSTFALEAAEAAGCKVKFYDKYRGPVR